MGKMGNRFVAMCSVAVGLIYTGAYEITAAQANSASTQANPPSASSSIQSTGKASSSAYKDGTYTGSGTDRRGTVGVEVIITQGKIANVVINDYSMHYSESDINPVLLQEVIQRQSENVDVVSGATSSSENFQTAVQQALAQAQQST